MGRGLWARQGQGSRGRKAQPGQPSGQLEGCASLLTADAPGRGSQAGLQHEAAARPLSYHSRVTTHPSCWLSFSGCGDRADRPGSSRALQSQGGTRWAFCLQSCNSRTFGGEQRMGRVQTVLILLDPSGVSLGFPPRDYQQCV